MKLTFFGFMKALYFKFIDLLHFPFVKRGSNDPYHILYNEFLLIGKAMPSPAVLEIGSRNVTGITRRDLFPKCREYVGFDILPGEAVDVVGDVHKLSNHVNTDYFDIVYCISVLSTFYFSGKLFLKLIKL